MDSAEFDLQMQEEMAKWNELGAEPGRYQPGEGFLGMIFRFEALSNVLKSNGLVTEEELDEEFRRVSLSGLKTVRETVVEPAVERARQEAIRSQIMGPNGMPNMHIPKKKP